MRLLFVDACQRGVASRTLMLARAFISEFEKSSGNTVESAVLRDLDLRPLEAGDIIRRDELIDAGRLDDKMFALARQFARAERVLVAAPYWDLMFPAALKTYIEHIMVRKISFVYDESGPVGLCRADRLAYLTTSGSPVGENDFGAGYMRAIGKMVGIGDFYSVSAESLDIVGCDAEGILRRACDKAAKLGADFAV